MRVLVDMDGTIADFEKQFLKNWRERYPDRLWIPMEERNQFYLSQQYPEEFREDIYAIFSEQGFFRSLEPLAGGLQAMHDMKDAGLDVFICTTPFRVYDYCVVEKYQWVEAHLGHWWTERIILTRDKTVVSGDVIIDDNPHIKGAEPFPTWRHIPYKQPYNDSEFTWDKWREVLL